MSEKRGRAENVLQAWKTLRLPSTANLQQIRTAYRELARDVHPDVHPPAEAEDWGARLRELNAAYEAVIDYCERHAFSCDEREVTAECRKQDPHEYWRARFFE